MDTFLRGRPQGMPLVVGSVKGNLGHTEPTAGLAGLLKAVLILEKGVIPATPTHKSLSPDVAEVLGSSLVQVSPGLPIHAHMPDNTRSRFQPKIARGQTVSSDVFLSIRPDTAAQMHMLLLNIWMRLCPRRQMQ